MTPDHPPSKARRLLRRLLIAFLLLLGLMGAAAGAAYSYFMDRVVPALDAQLSRLPDYQPPTVCEIYDRHDEVIDSFYKERRIRVPLEKISGHLIKAVIASEDRRFYSHQGFDLRGIFRALLRNISVGRLEEGGSTISQQLVKRLVVGNERSLDRKFREALLAWRLEHIMDKKQILELYLNLVYLGSGNYGVEAAARDYFGKSARKLELPEAAMIVGLIPSPSQYSPSRNPTLAEERRDIVLRAMAEAGYISEKEAESLHYFLYTPPKRPMSDDTSLNSYRTEVRRQVRKLLGTQQPFDKGLRIHTSFDPAIQEVAERAVSEAAKAVEERQGHAGRLRRVEGHDLDMFLLKAPGIKRDPTTGEALEPKPGDCFQAMFWWDFDDEIRAGSLRLPLPPKTWLTQVRSREPDEPPRSLWETLKTHHVFEFCADAEGKLYLRPRSWVQGAAVVLENKSGGVVAMVGGVNMPLEGFNRATQARRQPGSSFKPIVYAAALESGLHQTDIIRDAPLTLRSGVARWHPRNYDRRYRGRITLREALAKSVNTVAVRLSQKVGLNKVIEMAHRLGVRTPIRHDPTIALGSGELSVMDEVRVYATIARMGRSVEPSFIQSIVDHDGLELGKAGKEIRLEQGPPARLPGGPGEQVLDPATAYELLDMLKEVVHSGTARHAYRPGFERAGKTGSTDDYVDAWFAGVTPDYTIVVWLGCDDNSTLGHGEVGGRAALPAWQAIADALEDHGLHHADPEGHALLHEEGASAPGAHGRTPQEPPTGRSAADLPPGTEEAKGGARAFSKTLPKASSFPVPKGIRFVRRGRSRIAVAAREEDTKK